MHPKLTAEQRQALSDSSGLIIVEDDILNRKYVLIDAELFDRIQRDADVASIRQGIADVEAGRTSSIEEVRTRMANVLTKRRVKE